MGHSRCARGGVISIRLACDLCSSPLFDDPVDRSWPVPQCLLQVSRLLVGPGCESGSIFNFPNFPVSMSIISAASSCPPTVSLLKDSRFENDALRNIVRTVSVHNHFPGTSR